MIGRKGITEKKWLKNIGLNLGEILGAKRKISWHQNFREEYPAKGFTHKQL